MPSSTQTSTSVRLLDSLFERIIKLLQDMTVDDVSKALMKLSKEDVWRMVETNFTQQEWSLLRRYTRHTLPVSTVTIASFLHVRFCGMVFPLQLPNSFPVPLDTRELAFSLDDPKTSLEHHVLDVVKHALGDLVSSWATLQELRRLSGSDVLFSKAPSLQSLIPYVVNGFPERHHDTLDNMKAPVGASTPVDEILMPLIVACHLKESR